MTLTCHGFVSYRIEPLTIDHFAIVSFSKNAKIEILHSIFKNEIRNDYPKFIEKNKKRLYKKAKSRLYTFLLRFLPAILRVYIGAAVAVVQHQKFVFS